MTLDERRELWQRIRAERAGGASVAGLARRYGVSDRQIRRRARAENWSEAPIAGADIAPDTKSPASGHSDTDRNVIVLTDRIRRAAQARGADVANVASADVTDAQLTTALRRVALQLLDDCAAGRIQPGQHQSRADVAKTVVDAAARAIDVSRRVAGKLAGQPSVDSEVDPDAGRLIVEHVQLEPMKIAVNDRGRAIDTSMLSAIVPTAQPYRLPDKGMPLRDLP